MHTDCSAPMFSTNSTNHMSSVGIYGDEKVVASHHTSVHAKPHTSKPATRIVPGYKKYPQETDMQTENRRHMKSHTMLHKNSADISLVSIHQLQPSTRHTSKQKQHPRNTPKMHPCIQKNKPKTCTLNITGHKKQHTLTPVFSTSHVAQTLAGVYVHPYAHAWYQNSFVDCVVALQTPRACGV